MSSCKKKRKKRMEERARERNKPLERARIAAAKAESLEAPAGQKKEKKEQEPVKKPYNGPIARGDAFFFDRAGNGESGRPGIVVSNNMNNRYSRFVQVVYCTMDEKTKLPTHARITSLPKETVAMCEQVHTVPKERITSRYGNVNADEMCMVDKALAISLSLNSARDKRSADISALETLDACISAIQALKEAADAIAGKAAS